MIKAIQRFIGSLKSFEQIDDFSSERLSNSFERLDVFNKQVSKSFERFNVFLTNRWAKNNINYSFERRLDVSTKQVIKLFERNANSFLNGWPRPFTLRAVGLRETNCSQGN